MRFWSQTRLAQSTPHYTKSTRMCLSGMDCELLFCSSLRTDNHMSVVILQLRKFTVWVSNATREPLVDSNPAFETSGVESHHLLPSQHLPPSLLLLNPEMLPNQIRCGEIPS